MGSRGMLVVPSGAGGITKVGVEEVPDWTMESAIEPIISLSAAPGSTFASARKQATVATFAIVSDSA